MNSRFWLISSALFFSSLSSVAETPKERSFFYDGKLRVREELVDWYALPEVDSSYTYTHAKLQAGLGYEAHGVTAYAQGQYFQLWDLEDAHVGPGSVYRGANDLQDNPFGISLRQGYIKTRIPGEKSLTLQGGRFLYSSGAERVSESPLIEQIKKKRIADRLIGPFDFTAGRSFDGIRADYVSKVDHLFTGLIAHPTEGGFHSSTSRQIDDIDIGALVMSAPFCNGAAEWQAFYYYYGDERGAISVDARPLSIRERDKEHLNIHTVGGHLLHTWNLASNTVEALVWGAYQSGDWGAQSHRASSVDAEIGYRLDEVAWTPWLRTGYTYASGDRNPEDSRHTTFFEMLPTMRIYAQTPFYSLMNMHDYFVQLSALPTKKFGIKGEMHLLQLAQSSDLLYAGGGAGERSARFGYSGVTSSGAHEVGVLFDVEFSYKFNDAVTATAYYGHLNGEDVVAGNDSIDYALLEMVVGL